MNSFISNTKLRLLASGVVLVFAASTALGVQPTGGKHSTGGRSFAGSRSSSAPRSVAPSVRSQPVRSAPAMYSAPVMRSTAPARSAPPMRSAPTAYSAPAARPAPVAQRPTNYGAMPGIERPSYARSTPGIERPTSRPVPVTPTVRAPEVKSHHAIRAQGSGREVTTRPGFNGSNHVVLRPELNHAQRPVSRPDFNNSGRGTFPGVVAQRDGVGTSWRGVGPRFNSGYGFNNLWNASLYRHGINDHRLRYCGPFNSNYYCYGYRPLCYYPRAYPYAYSTVYFYDNWPSYSSFGAGYYPGTVAFADPGYATTYPTYATGDTYLPPSTAPSTGYVDNSGATYEAGGPSDQAPTQVVPEGEQPNTQYQSLTSTGANSALAEGNTAFRDGKFDDARQAYSRAVLGDERDGYAKMLYATANFAAGDYKVAATAVRRSLMTTPELVTYPIDVRSLYADPTTLYGQMDGLAKHLSSNPEDRDAALLLAYLHYSIGEPGPARDMFKLLAETDSNDALASELLAAATRAAESTQARPVQQAPKTRALQPTPGAPNSGPMNPGTPTPMMQPPAPEPSPEPPPHPDVP